MMSTPAETSGRKRPSERAIAFAISIVLSKPEELTVREYIQLLQQHVAKGRRENALSSVHRHLDRSSYWRSEYERLKYSLKVAENESIDLRRELDQLKAKVESIKSSSPVKKKRKPDEDVIPVPRSPKRSKQDASTARRSPNYTDAIADFDFSGIGEAGSILMRSFYRVHTILKATHRTEPRVLANELIRAAAAVPQVIYKVIESNNARPASDDDYLKHVLTATSRSILSLIMGFNRLSHVPKGAEVQGHVTYAYVKMYLSLTSALEVISQSEFRKSFAGELATPSTKKQSPSKVKARQPKAVNIKDNPMLNLLTKFLCNIIDLLDPKIEAQKALFEGFAYAVLEKLGAKLYVLVFCHGRGVTIEEEIMISNQPDRIEEGTEPSSVKQEELEIRGAKLEAPYLIHLLNRIMNAAPAHLGATTSKKTGKAKQANNKGSMKGALANSARDRLQKTLVNCMFGTEGIDEDDPLMDCLKMPALDDQGLVMPKVKELDVQDWFKEEVWRLLGWEILSGTAISEKLLPPRFNLVSNTFTGIGRLLEGAVLTSVAGD